jgi:pyruvate formate lyase activating enzyme
VRENRDGVYHTLVHGHPCAVHLDPIEKKPLFHVLPGTASFSLATAGCNLACSFCQNWEISQASPEEVSSRPLPPEEAVRLARSAGARSIAYTYVEPTIFYEYMTDIALLARREGLLNLVHSNAFINREPLERLCDLLGAANCDLKGFSDDYYREICSGSLAPVLESLKTYRRRGVHLELTNLLVPTRNDDPVLIREMCRWISGELGPDTPLHLTRFHPAYRLLNLPPTPVATLERAREAAVREGLRYVYLGNVPGHPAESTRCPACGKVVIRRKGFMVQEVLLSAGRCPCGERIPGVWA